jgi:glucose/arabinose dehydrogenase
MVKIGRISGGVLAAFLVLGQALAADLAAIRLPAGFKIETLVTDIPNARSMAFGAQGTLFVGSRSEGRLYALTDADGDGRYETQRVIRRGLNMPNGIDFRAGALYVAENHRLTRYDDIESRLDNPPRPRLIAALPSERHHGWRYLRFGPDGLLYLSIGAPCNICNEPGFATIVRMQPDGSGREIFARGVRNSIGFDWQPESQVLWFSDNGRDWLGDDLPPDELNRAPQAGLHFGYPFCHGGEVVDPEFGRLGVCDQYVAPALRLDAHVAPLGVRFYTGSQFPASYRGQLFIAEHGSWNRSTPVGYRIMLARVEQGRVVDYTPFAEGWLGAFGRVSGRPVDLLVAPDGALLVSDDKAGRIYRISYQGD